MVLRSYQENLRSSCDEMASNIWQHPTKVREHQMQQKYSDTNAHTWQFNPDDWVRGQNFADGPKWLSGNVLEGGKTIVKVNLDDGWIGCHHADHLKPSANWKWVGWPGVYTHHLCHWTVCTVELVCCASCMVFVPWLRMCGLSTFNVVLFICIIIMLVHHVFVSAVTENYTISCSLLTWRPWSSLPLCWVYLWEWQWHGLFLGAPFVVLCWGLFHGQECCGLHSDAKLSHKFPLLLYWIAIPWCLQQVYNMTLSQAQADALLGIVLLQGTLQFTSLMWGCCVSSW